MSESIFCVWIAHQEDTHGCAFRRIVRNEIFAHMSFHQLLSQLEDVAFISSTTLVMVMVMVMIQLNTQLRADIRILEWRALCSDPGHVYIKKLD